MPGLQGLDAPSSLCWPRLTTSHGSGGSRQLCPQRHLQSSGDSPGTLACAQAVGHFIGSQMRQQTVPVILKAYSVTLTQFLPRLWSSYHHLSRLDAEPRNSPSQLGN